MTAILSCLISGTLLFLSFPYYDLWPLAWVALVPLFIIVTRSSTKQAFWYGWLTGTIYFLGCIYWVSHTMVVYGGLPLPISFLVMLLLVVYLGLYVALFASFKKRLDSFPPLLQLFLVPALWVTLEWLRAHLLTGFPWVLLGYSQYQLLPVIQMADLTGVYGVSFLLILVNGAAARVVEILLERRTAREFFGKVWVPILLSCAFLLLSVLYGSIRITMLTEQPASRNLSVGLIQGNIEQAQKWDPAYRRRTIDIYKDLTRQAIRSSRLPEARFSPAENNPPKLNLDVVVWPETATPFFFEYEEKYREEMKTFIRDQNIPLLFGSPSLGPVPVQTPSGPLVYNSAYLVPSAGMLSARYDKMHLVPFGEYVPLSSMLFFVRKLVEDIGELGAGTEFTVMDLSGSRFGVVICFEVIFPELVRQFVKNGAQFMATLTNDAWYGWSSAPYQHFSMAVFRSIENRIPFIRAANTGITGSIDATGRIQGTTPLFVTTYLVQRIQIKETKSFYTQYGDLFAYLCGIITLAVIAPRWRREKRKLEARNVGRI